MILVVGATGMLGGRISKRLLADGRPVRVVRARVRHVVRSGWSLPEPTVRFWNALFPYPATDSP